MNTNKIIFNRLKVSRLLNGDKDSNKKISEAMGVHLNTVGLWKRAESSPSAEALALIAARYGKDINYFYDIETSSSDLNPKEIEGSEYLLKRFEEMAGELAVAKAKLAEYEKVVGSSFALQNVSDNKTEEKGPELKKAEQI